MELVSIKPIVGRVITSHFIMDSNNKRVKETLHLHADKCLATPVSLITAIVEREFQTAI